MKNLTLTLEEEISILDKYRITPNELMFIRTLLLLQDEENEDIFKSYIEALYKCEVKTREVILSLQSKGIILKNFHCPNEGEAFDPYSIPFNKNFIKNLYRCSFEMGKELFEAYPQFGIIGTSTVPLRTVAKKFDSLEEIDVSLLMLIVLAASVVVKLTQYFVYGTELEKDVDGLL